MRLAILAAFALLSLVGATSTQAQSRDETADLQTRASLAERLIAVTARDNMAKVLHDATEQIITSQSEATEEQQAWNREHLPDLMEQNIGGMIDRMEALYAERLTTAELRALVEFYEAPAGRIIANKQNALGVLVGEEMITYMQGFYADYRAKYCGAFDCPRPRGQSMGDKG